MTRQEFIKSGIGLSGILASGRAPAFIRGLLGTSKFTEVKDEFYDSEIEYLESKTGAWIDTAVQTADKVQMCLLKRISGGDVKIWGNSYYLGRWADIMFFGSKYRGTSIPEKIGVWDVVTIEKSPRLLTVERGDETFSADSWFSASNGYMAQYGTAVPLFGHINQFGPLVGDCRLSYASTNYIRVMFFKAWRGSVIIRDLIPVRIGMEGAMYDRVSRKIFHNCGSDSFILGSDKE